MSGAAVGFRRDDELMEEATKGTTAGAETSPAAPTTTTTTTTTTADTGTTNKTEEGGESSSKRPHDAIGGGSGRSSDVVESRGVADERSSKRLKMEVRDTLLSEFLKAQHIDTEKDLKILGPNEQKKELVSMYLAEPLSYFDVPEWNVEKWEKVFPVNGAAIHGRVHAALDAEGVIRGRLSSVDSLSTAEKKREAALDAKVGRIKCIPEDDGHYRDAKGVPLVLPFPFVGEPHPRIMLDDNGDFQFSPRTQFGVFHEHVAGLGTGSGQKRHLLLYGTVGYGKSHILAAEAALLMRRGERVVYLPDCKEMIRDPQAYVKMALRLALKVAPLEATAGGVQPYDALLEVDTREEGALLQWMHGCRIGPGTFTFLVGQSNSLDPKGRTLPRKAVVCEELLTALCSDQVRIEESSANNAVIKEEISSQSRITRVDCFGGLTDAEYASSEACSRLSQLLDDEARERVEFATGCIPLYLNAFIGCLGGAGDDEQLSDEAVEAAWEVFRELDVVDNVGAALRGFYESHKDPEKAIGDTFNFLVGGSAASVHPDNYDARFFYRDEHKVGRYVCGLAREVMDEVIYEHRQQQLYLEASSLPDDPISLGFMAEKAALAVILRDGLHFGSTTCKPTSANKHVVTFIKGKEATVVASASSGDWYLFKPRAFNYPSIDGLLYSALEENADQPVPVVEDGGGAVVWREASTIDDEKDRPDGVIIPVQITRQKNVSEHFEKTLKFFDSRCASWSGKVLKPALVLVWVIKASEKTEAIDNLHGSMMMRNGRSVIQYFFTFADMGLEQYD